METSGKEVKYTTIKQGNSNICLENSGEIKQGNNDIYLETSGEDM